MARKLPENPEIQRLIRLSQASRSRLDSEAAALKHRLDFPARIRSSLRQHPLAWLLGSLGSGLAASLMVRRRSAVAPQKKRGMPGVLLGLTLTAARPLAKLWLNGQIKQWTAGLSETSRPSSAPTRVNLTNPPNPAHVHSPGSGPR
jgi:hypothetical protein